MRREYRLRSKKDFKTLFTKGRKTDTRLFRLVIRPNALNHPRFAFVTPRSIEKRAVWRNRARRQAREWIRRNPEFFTKPMDLVLIFKKEAVLATKKLFYEELRQALARALGD